MVPGPPVPEEIQKRQSPVVCPFSESSPPVFLNFFEYIRVLLAVLICKATTGFHNVTWSIQRI